MNLQSVLVLNVLLVTITVILSVADVLLGSNRQQLLRINDDRELSTSGGGTLLDSLAEQRIFIPAACGGKGTCGHCKVVVEEGGGDVLPTEEGFLTPQEREEGVRLACQVKVREDLSIRVHEALLEAQEYLGEVVVLEDLNYDTKFLKVKLLSPRTIDFKAGQYVQILVPGYEEFRAYSIASPPSQRDALDFVIRLIPKGLCTTYIHKALAVGDTIRFTGPFGDFFLNEQSDRDITCLARGTGIAPIRSITLHLKEQGMPRNVSFYFSARTKKDILQYEEFKQLEAEFPNFKYYVVLSRPAPEDNWDGETGYITDTVAKYQGDSLKDTEIYLCGPGVMIDAAMEVFDKIGVPKEQVFFDKF
ncbi:MAG: 2Fe-2S iron-sulfur cluster binding domain-containing protein [Bacillota bacterium]